MHVSMATSGGNRGEPNEDFAGAVPGAVVLLDGAGIPGTEAICCHGVAWYTHRLGGALLGRLSRDDGAGLTAILGGAIGEVAADHRDTCDIANVSSPQATVVVIRSRGARLDYLVLADSFLVLSRISAGPLVITDEREVMTRRACSAPLASVARGSTEYQRVWDACLEALQARRNQPGGYWIAKDDPAVAGEAVTGSYLLQELDAAALLSNGAARVRSLYAHMTWLGVLEVLRASGPDEVIRRVRRAERIISNPNPTTPDDATVAYCTQLQHLDVHESRRAAAAFHR